jgi:hypothetical protein
VVLTERVADVVAVNPAVLELMTVPLKLELVLTCNV